MYLDISETLIIIIISVKFCIHFKVKLSFIIIIIIIIIIIKVCSWHRTVSYSTCMLLSRCYWYNVVQIALGVSFFY